VAHLGDGQVRRAQQILRALDASLGEVQRRCLPVRRREAAQEVILRHARGGGESVEVKRVRVLAIGGVFRPPQVDEQRFRNACHPWRA
jgi:hypothetical protein